MYDEDGAPLPPSEQPPPYTYKVSGGKLYEVDGTGRWWHIPPSEYESYGWELPPVPTPSKYTPGVSAANAAYKQVNDQCHRLIEEISRRMPPPVRRSTRVPGSGPRSVSGGANETSNLSCDTDPNP